MSASEPQNLPDVPTPLTYEVVRTIHDDKAPAPSFPNVTLHRLVQVVKLDRKVQVRVGREDKFLSTDHVTYETYKIERHDNNGNPFIFSDTALVACEEDGKSVPGATLYAAPTDVPLFFAMYAIGVN